MRLQHKPQALGYWREKPSIEDSYNIFWGFTLILPYLRKI